MTMFNEETIYSILEYKQKKEKEFQEQALSDDPQQTPFSQWAVEEIIGELKLDYTRYPDEIVRNFISLMDKYEEVSEPERRPLFRTARETAKDLYSYLFDDKNGKEN